MNIEISKINFPLYGTIILLAIFIGYMYIIFCLKNRSLKNIIYIFPYFYLSILFGMALDIIINYPNTYKMEVGLSSYGCGLGVIITAIIVEKIGKYKDEFIKYSVLSLPLTYSIGKIACFLVGCCFGLPYNGIFSVVYKDYLKIEVFPIQLVETIVFLILFLICNKLKNKKNIISITIVSSALVKFLLDFFRYEHINKIITWNQIISIIVIILTVIFCFCKKSKNEE